MNESQFNVFLAVPAAHEEDKEESRVQFDEHLFTISQEDLEDTFRDEITPTEDLLRDTTNKKTPIINQGRRQFRQCQSKCVQTSCLPVSQVSDYSECVESCKNKC